MNNQNQTETEKNNLKGQNDTLNVKLDNPQTSLVETISKPINKNNIRSFGGNSSRGKGFSGNKTSNKNNQANTTKPTQEAKKEGNAIFLGKENAEIAKGALTAKTQPLANKNNNQPTKPKNANNQNNRQAKKGGQNKIDDTILNTEIGEVLQEKGKHSTKNSAKLRVVFLGGVGEIGKNMTALEYGNDIIVVDCGVSFPTSDMPGIDLVIPDITYLKENKTKIRGLLLTHGHEDHIGAVPFVAKDLGLIDIYGSKLTLALVENKLIERNATENVKKHVVNDQDVAKLGVFSVEFLRVTHSVAGSLALSITTPVGVVFFTGDFKIDHTPTHSLPMNLPRIAEIGSHGVALLLCDSTNVEREGYTPSEKILSQKFREIFEREKSHRLFVATFSSNVDRLQEVFDLAKEFGRKVAISGRSMQNVVETAGNAGYIKYDKNILIPLNQLEKQPYDKMVILTTGSQGEPMSALTRMASGEFNKIALSKNDTIIISATPIPGNEKDVYRVINNLFRLGCNVVYSEIEDVHVSGHAYKEELKLIHSLVMPKFFIPVHGEYRHLWQHQRLAIEMGLSPKNSTIVEIGDVVELGKDKMTIKEKVVAGNVFIDGLGIGDIGSNILKDRLALAEDGIVIVVCGIENGQVSAKPQVFSRGCFYTGDNSNEGTVEEIKQLVRQELASANLVKLDVSSIKGAITKQLRGYFRKKFQRFPMLLVVVMSSELDV